MPVLSGRTDTAELQALIDAGGEGTVVLDAERTYFVTSTLTISNNGTHISGGGVFSTNIDFAPTVDDSPCFHFTKGASEHFNCSIERLRIVSTDTTHRMTAIQADDFSQFKVLDVMIRGFDNDKDSVGLHTRGRENSSFGRLRIEADVPIRIGINPNTTQFLDGDHFHFFDTYLTPNNGSGGGSLVRASMLVDDMAHLSNFKIDGRNAWVSEGHGFYHVSTGVGTRVSNNVKISGIRWEQNTGTDDWCIRIERVAGNIIQGLTIEDCYGDGNKNGCLLRRCDGVVLQHYLNTTPSSKIAWDIDECREVVRINSPNFNDDATVNLTGLTEVFSPNRRPGLTHPWTADYTGGATGVFAFHAQKPIFIYGTPVWAWTGELTDDAQVQIPINTQQNAVKAATVTVVASDGSTVLESGTWIMAPVSGLDTGVTKLTGTTNTASTNSDTDLCVYCSGSTPIVNNVFVKNRLGVTCDVAVFAFYAQ